MSVEEQPMIVDSVVSSFKEGVAVAGTTLSAFYLIGDME